MSELPPTYDVASGFVALRADDAWQKLRDIEHWPEVFADWIAAIEVGDDHFTATGPTREKFDLYPQTAGESRALDVEVVDELGSADVLRLRVLDMPGGALVLVAHGRLSGTSDDSWNRKRDGIASGLLSL